MAIFLAEEYINKHPHGGEAQLAWKRLYTPTVLGGWLTHKAGQTDLVFGVR